MAFLLDSWVYRGNHAFYDNALRILATDTLPPEKWSYTGKTDFYILRSYLSFTYEKLASERELADPCSKEFYIYESQTQACFNTGLLDKNWQIIYYYCVPNNVPGFQKWKFQGFYNNYTIRQTGIPANVIAQLHRPNYFSDPSALIFDIKLPIVPQWDHILDDQENYMRIPEQIRTLGRDTCRSIIAGAIDNAKLRIESNYKIAVPQWYRNKIQLLAPLYLTNQTIPDLALALSLSPDKSQYYGHTCLTIEWAYNNARLIARPESFWLQP